MGRVRSPSPERVPARLKGAPPEEDVTMALAPPPFRFSARRTRIDWQTLHGVDIQRLVRLSYLHQPNFHTSMWF